ncbi:MAG: Mur ligase family protein [Candidatus Uhrbacteria bacterium]
MKSFVEKLLARLSQRVVSRYQPRIIAITGSVGKTSTKNAIVAVLHDHFNLRTCRENYNSEFGVPLTIIDAKSPGHSAVGWFLVLLKGFFLAYGSKQDYPELLVLEFGVDHPGDMAKLCQIAPPEIGVVTRISPVHVEHFDDLEHLAQEKSELIKRLPESGLSVLNANDQLVARMSELSKAQVRTYGFDLDANVQGSAFSDTMKFDDNFQPGETVAMSMFRVNTALGQFDLELKNIVGQPAAFSALAAIAVGLHLGLSLDDFQSGLSNFVPMPGRTRLIPGIKGSMIIDDSYNAAPASTLAALDILHEFSPIEEARRIAVLGDMLELGSMSEDEHRRVGRAVVKSDVDLLVTVGERSIYIAEEAKQAGMSQDKIQSFGTAEEAGRFLDPDVRTGDIILVKGSQGIRTEKIVKELMAEPLRAKELLVRQYPPWVTE